MTGRVPSGDAEHGRTGHDVTERAGEAEEAGGRQLKNRRSCGRGGSGRENGRGGAPSSSGGGPPRGDGGDRIETRGGDRRGQARPDPEQRPDDQDAGRQVPREGAEGRTQLGG